MHVHFISSLFSAICAQILVLQCVKVTGHQSKTTFRLREERLGFPFFLQILQESALLLETHLLLKGVLRIIVTDVFRCKTTRLARGGVSV